MGHDPAKDFNDRLIAFMTSEGGRNFGPTTIKPLPRADGI